MKSIKQLKQSLLLCKSIFHAKLFLFQTLTNRNKKTYLQKKHPPKIIHINTDDIVGGAARVANDLFSHQLEAGLESSMLVRTKKSDHSLVYELKNVFSKKQKKLLLANEYLDWQDFFNLSIFEKSESGFFKKFDIVHLHNLHGGYFSPLILPALSRSNLVIWTLHDMHAITGHCAHSFGCQRWMSTCGNCPDLNLYPKLTKDSTREILEFKKKIYSKSKLEIIAVSNWMLDKINKSILCDKNVTVIHNGVDTNIFKLKSKKILREKYGVATDKKVVLFSANSGLENPYKGGEFVSKIISDFSDTDILFINIGSNVIKKSINKWEISFVSEQNEMADWYNIADVFLYPSIADNCPLVVLESMACGCPVLSFRTGGIPELIIHGTNGYLANQKDYEDLKIGLLTILKDDNLRKSMSESSIKRVVENFTLQIMFDKYQRIYEKLQSEN